MAKTELKTASVLAFERKLDPSDALFSAGRWDDRANGERWPALGLHEKSVRGTISNRGTCKIHESKLNKWWRVPMEGNNLLKVIKLKFRKKQYLSAEVGSID